MAEVSRGTHRQHSSGAPRRLAHSMHLMAAAAQDTRESCVLKKRLTGAIIHWPSRGSVRGCPAADMDDGLVHSLWLLAALAVQVRYQNDTQIDGRGCKGPAVGTAHGPIQRGPW